MAEEFSLVGFAMFCAEMIVEVDHKKREALEAGAKIIEKEAKRVIGTYDYGWPELAESTQQEREREGFPADEPGLRTGEMRDSIQHRVIDDKEAQIGSDDQHLVYFELGTVKQPPRPVLSQAAVHKEKEVAHEMGRVIVKQLLPAGMAVPEPEYKP
jgi:HK97 gp10 family phage protein